MALNEAQLDRIERKLDALQRRLDGELDPLRSAANDMFATLGDTLDDLVDRGRARGIEPEAFIEALLGRDLLRKDNVILLARALGELGNAAAVPTGRVGLIALISALREPEIQRSLGFLIAYARRLGAVLDEIEAPAALGEGHGGDAGRGEVAS